MNVTFHWIGGATFILSVGQLKIAVDPVLCLMGTVQDYFWFKSVRLEAPVFEPHDFDDVDLWLITHNHEDHLDAYGLEKISDKSSIVSNRNGVAKLRKARIRRMTVLDWAETARFNLKGYELEVEAIPAIHGVNPVSAFFAGKVNGYYLRISDETEHFSIYITGDTVYKKKVVGAIGSRNVDLLIPNMGAAKQGSLLMTLTLDAAMLRKMITVLNPEMVVPVHYGTFKHYREPVSKIEELNDPRIRFVKVGGSIILK